jgi:rSAM/selenodomain-associated transferase 1
MNATRCAIAVMAKAPRAGAVKTRLVPPLTPDQARRASAAFLKDVTENVRLAGTRAPIDGYVAYAPQGLEHLFDGMLADGTRLVLADGTGDMPEEVAGFGRCLLHAMRALFARGYGGVCLLNSDSPDLPTARLVEAAAALASPGDRVVLGPAEDGGYYLIGMKAAHARLFADIAWSTDAVAAATRQRAEDVCLPLTELAPWYDVDDAASLQRFLRRASGPRADDGAFPAPATGVCLRGLGLFDLMTTSAAE